MWKNQQDQQEGDAIDQVGEQIYLNHWWEVFEDAKLDELESSAKKNNHNLFVAYERIQEARALMGVAAASFYPQMTLNPLTTNTLGLVKNDRNSASVPSADAALIAALTKNNVFRTHQLLYLLPVDLRYEVDLWGKIREQYRSARYDWLAQKKGYEAVMLTLTSNLATIYYQLRTADAQIELLLKVLHTRQKAYDINLARYEEGIAFYADAALAAEEMDLVLNQHREVCRQRALLENQIAVLIGIPPSVFSLESLPLGGPPPCIPAGIPSEALLRRPDIAEAEYAMQSQHALVKEAYSHFFPSLTLTAAGGFESPILKNFLKVISRYWTDGLQIGQLIFDGGRISSELQLQMARFHEASGSYQQQVLMAFEEVENSLANLESFRQQYQTAQGGVQWAEKTHQLYLDRYRLGVSNYLNVADTERDLLNDQVNLYTLQGLRYVATVELIKTLGGGWSSYCRVFNS